MEGSREAKEKEKPIECGYCERMAVCMLGGTTLCKRHKRVAMMRRQVLNAFETGRDDDC